MSLSIKFALRADEDDILNVKLLLFLRRFRLGAVMAAAEVDAVEVVTRASSVIALSSFPSDATSNDLVDLSRRRDSEGREDGSDVCFWFVVVEDDDASRRVEDGFNSCMASSSLFSSSTFKISNAAKDLADLTSLVFLCDDDDCVDDGRCCVDFVSSLIASDVVVVVVIVVVVGAGGATSVVLSKFISPMLPSNDLVDLSLLRSVGRSSFCCFVVVSPTSLLSLSVSLLGLLPLATASAVVAGRSDDDEA